ncbi:Mediator of RNA polymerase II transcription subunit 1 [Trichoplax sp. H2]|nr:Mediator of RNA polymerase II transcription subunit 1 [Trichoplax sp. H2]|eukprot:RDD42687.1 Mediator of RNA polymerase II transcription subunit 1 [Trichoplax sp. H2]
MSIGNEIEKWKEILKGLQDEFIHSDSDGSKIHPFAENNFNQIHANFKNSIANMKQHLDNILQMDNSSRILLLCQDKFQQQENCKYIKSYLRNIIESLGVHSSASDTDYIPYLEIIARSANLKFVHHGDNCFISSDMFYVEITLKNHKEVTEVKVVHGEDPKVTPVMTDLLRKRQFQEFKKHLLGLSSLYQLFGTSTEKSLAFMALQAVETDLSTLAAYQNLSGQNNPMEIINKGYVGHVTEREGGLPMKLTFYISPKDMFDNNTSEKINLEDAIIKGRAIGFSASVLIEQGKKCLLPKLPVVVLPTQVTDVPSYKKLCNENSAELPASFVLVFDDFIPVDASIMAKIYKIVKGQDKVYINSSSATIEDLLASNFREEKAKNGFHRNRNSSFVVKLPDQKQKYVFCKSLDSVPLGTLNVKRIPFLNPQQVPRIITLLRQQIVFNELISSCVCGQPNDLRDDEVGITTFEVITFPPNLLCLTFQHPLSDFLMSVEISVNENGTVSGRACVCPGDVSFCTDEYITRILQACLSIPVTLRAILRKSVSYSANQQGDSHDIAIPSSAGSTDAENQVMQFSNILSPTTSLSMKLTDAVEQNPTKRKRNDSEIEEANVNDFGQESAVRVVEAGTGSVTETKSASNDNNEIETPPTKVFIEDTDVMESPIVGETEYSKMSEMNDKPEDENNHEPEPVVENIVTSAIEEPADARVVSELEAFVHNTVHDSPSTLSKDPATYLQTVDLSNTTAESNSEPINDVSIPESDRDEIDRLPNPASIGEMDSDGNIMITSIDEVITGSILSVEDSMVATSDPGMEGADLLSAISDLAGSGSVNLEKSDDPSSLPSINDPTISKLLGLSREDETELDEEMIAGAEQNLLGLASYNSPEMDDSFAQIGSIIGEPDKELEEEENN